MLELRNVYKRFSGIPAVSGASFTAQPGEVTVGSFRPAVR